MGKKARKPTPGAPLLSEADSQTVTGLKEEGNKLFGRKEYAKALDAYERALKLIPEGHGDKALLHSNKAACYMMFKRFKEAINECSSALEEQPTYHKALIRRAKAYEQLGHYKQALSDIQKANKGDAASADSAEIEKRLKDILSGKRAPGPLANGAAKKSSRSPGGRGQTPFYFQAKCQLGDETRLLHLSANVTYMEVAEGVRQQFPNVPHFVLKYVDREGDLVTITQRADITRALNEIVEHVDRVQTPHGGRLPAQAVLPPLRIQVVPAKTAEEVPKAPESEEQAFQQLLAAQKALFERAKQAKESAPKAEPEQQEMVEIDQWLLDFAQLFRDTAGIDPERHLDLQQLGWDKVQEALETTLTSDKALPLFNQAADKFQEVACMGLLQWGNVFTCVARKYIDDAAVAGQSPSEVAPKAEEEWAKAEQKFNEALGFKADFVDGFTQLANLYLDRAKLYSGFLVSSKATTDTKEGNASTESESTAKDNSASAEKTPEEQAAAQEAALAASKAMLDKLEKSAVEGAEEYWEQALGFAGKATGALPESERVIKPVKKDNAEKTDKPAQEGQQPAEEEFTIYASLLILKGNLLYEKSQMAAAVGLAWRPLLDTAEKCFKDAGCAAADIRAALKNHYKAEELDLGPDPELEAPKPKEEPKAAEPPAAATEEAPKGLPALGPKPKKKVDKAEA